MKKLLFFVFAMLSIYSGVSASPLSVFNTSDGWTQFAGDDGFRYSDGYVGPGYGRQSFDAEYLFYKIQNNILSIGLQTGFDVIDGRVLYDKKNYYSGDLALSFDGMISNGYEYAVDFGLFTRDYVNFDTVGGNKALGIDTAGIYKVNSTGWNKDVIGTYGSSNPFAMQTGQLLAAFDSSANLKGSGSTDTTYAKIGGIKYSYGGFSYYRIVSFPVYLIPVTGNTINLDAHWTMSCGNDVLNGSAVIQRPNLPEPGTMFLLGSLATGLFGLAGLRKRFTK